MGAWMVSDIVIDFWKSTVPGALRSMDRDKFKRQFGWAFSSKQSL